MKRKKSEEPRERKTEEKQKPKMEIPSINIFGSRSVSELIKMIEEMSPKTELRVGYDGIKKAYDSFKFYVENELPGGYEVSELTEILHTKDKYTIIVNRIR